MRSVVASTIVKRFPACYTVFESPLATDAFKMATRDVLTAILMDELAENEEIEQICATTLAEFESQRAIECK